MYIFFFKQLNRIITKEWLFYPAGGELGNKQITAQLKKVSNRQGY